MLFINYSDSVLFIRGHRLKSWMENFRRIQVLMCSIVKRDNKLGLCSFYKNAILNYSYFCQFYVMRYFFKMSKFQVIKWQLYGLIL